VQQPFRRLVHTLAKPAERCFRGLAKVPRASGELAEGLSTTRTRLRRRGRTRAASWRPCGVGLPEARTFCGEPSDTVPRGGARRAARVGGHGGSPRKGKPKLRQLASVSTSVSPAWCAPFELASQRVFASWRRRVRSRTPTSQSQLSLRNVERMRALAQFLKAAMELSMYDLSDAIRCEHAGLGGSGMWQAFQPADRISVQPGLGSPATRGEAGASWRE
jgi:hypothetical protein